MESIELKLIYGKLSYLSAVDVFHLDVDDEVNTIIPNRRCRTQIKDTQEVFGLHFLATTLLAVKKRDLIPVAHEKKKKI